MTAEFQPANGRVTLALVVQKLDALASSFDKAEAKTDEYRKQQSADIHAIQLCMAGESLRVGRVESDVKDHDSAFEKVNGRIDGLKRRDDNWNSINTLIGAVAAVLGAIGIKQQ